jgi:hypothetical protein
MKPMKAYDPPPRAIVHDRLTDKRTFAFVGYPGASILVPLLRCWQLREHLNAQNGEPIQHFVDGVSVKVEMNVDRHRQALHWHGWQLQADIFSPRQQGPDLLLLSVNWHHVIHRKPRFRQNTVADNKIIHRVMTA